MSIRLLPRRKWLRRIVIGMCVTAGTLVASLFILIFLSVVYPFPMAQIKTTETRARTIRIAIQHWQDAERSTNCPTIEQLLSEKQLTQGDSVVDAWEHSFELECIADEVFVTSPGPDRMLGTADDIRIPKRDPDDGTRVAAQNARRDAGRAECGPLTSCVRGQ